MLRADTLQITPEILTLIARIDEFKGAWRALGRLASDRLSALRRVATIESIGSSTRIEGSKLSDREVEQLLSTLEIKSFATRDEQEVAGYAELMDRVFSSWQDIPFTENHIKQLHQVLLRYSEKDSWHRGTYKANSNSVAAFDETGAQTGIVFQTASPFDTPRLMTELVDWVNKAREQQGRTRLSEQVRRLEKKVEREKLVLAALPDLALQILEFTREHGRVTIGETIKLTGASRNTLKQHLRNLVAQGHLHQRGSGRGVWYELK